MNTTRRWSFKQTGISLAPGSNVVFCYGGAKDAGSLGLFSDTATYYWSDAQTRVAVDVEFASVSDLSTFDVHVTGYAFQSEKDGYRNIAAKVVNSGSASVVVTLVWHFEAFVQNYSNGTPG
jgi:hypothetical protein